MSIHVALRHRTRYTYDRLVSHTPHVIRLRPAPHCRTRVLSYSLKVEPIKHFLNWQQDPFGNYLARVVFPDRARELLVDVELTAEMAVYNPFDFFLEPSAESFPFAYDDALKQDLKPFLEAVGDGPLLTQFVESIPRQAKRTVDFLVHLNQRLWRDIKYLIRLEPGVQSPEETLRLGSGSCRDSGWLLVQTMRRLGMAARFVSGYLIQLKPDVRALDGPSGAEQDFTDLHAWCEVYLPGAGWIGLDPTSGLLAGEGHLPVACTPEPSSAAPICGAVDECVAHFEHEMRVTRVFESARVTKPYTKEQWGAIDTCGRLVDAELLAGDVRLSMGGEPTFISIDHMDAVEWNFTAVGPDKRRLSDLLIRRLKARFGPGGLLHLGQGKWYPGESLPRWAFSCFWRTDGLPVWKEDALLADASTDYGHNETHAHAFMSHLAKTLGVDVAHIMPAYEDAWFYLWRERQLPANVDPLEARLEDKEERDRLARVFEQGLGKVVGYALPVQRHGTDRSLGWVSGPWFLRREHCYLVPGDSPMGLRLPLDSLPWVHETDYPYIHHPDTMVAQPPLPAPEALRQLTAPVLGTASSARTGAPRWERPVTDRPAPAESADWVVRTALCVEPRGGRLHIFMPPVATLEDYLTLIAAIEATAQELSLPVTIEGETPPADPRLRVLKVTPDPGVIEVNVAPVLNWDDLVSQTEAVYEEARLCRLGTEKFMIDGRHSGTGGGNHVVLGGATAGDSPLLRRPDLLRSLLCFWQNHPSLSFLFSGLFIGPTSQHPRVDEARNDALYELEIAFQQVPDAGAVPPWLVDRLFRHLLVDATGNTHRAEFCIDKLFAPEGSAGRMGLLELRAFEMPPHAQMSLTQKLLLRALIARFWKQPYQQPLVRWGTSLHDRFMLPHFVDEDFADVLSDLQDFGYPFEREWFAPHFEFRFPKYGDVTYAGVNLELRQALEPWHVLGEQGEVGGTVRYVDSSLERLQIKVCGLTESRHVVTCNGQLLPLHPTGVEGEAVAGVRFRAWQPPECLHPTTAVHAPLTFDLVDTWKGRSLGGCIYHVSHPGGLSYSTRPVNSYEAESRRLARFSHFGHTIGFKRVVPSAVNASFPLTLDLRRG